MKASAESLEHWLDSRRARVEQALDDCLTARLGAPPPIVEAMRYSLLAGGKRLRPLLVLAAAEACAPRVNVGVDDVVQRALPVACAIELIHTYSLIHDDLPSMDNDSLRRGRPTSHVVHGEAMAILAGDALLTEAFALLSRPPLGPASADLDTRRLRVIRLVADAAGPAGMVGGQVLDMQATATPLDQASLRAMHARKTGALIQGSVAAGAVMAGADDATVNAVDAYGEQIGLAFQIVDDILDVEGHSSELGKTAGKDAAAGKPTYPSLYGLPESRRLAASCVEQALAAIDRVRLEGQLPAIAQWIVSRTR